MNAASYIDEKWDKVIDLFMRRTVYGAVTGGVSGAILCSGA